MKLPKFLLADNSQFPDDLFVVHTEFPSFILNIATDEVEWMDELEAEDGVNLEEEVAIILDKAYEFYEQEMDSFDEEDEEDEK
ncbi:MAG: hypothetical protein Q8J84_03480 [Flavobacteriaceae bacterium]|nr:hypothetical protein [Flavobacteriaceae bacterium]